jgi:hypothetical protein
MQRTMSAGRRRARFSHCTSTTCAVEPDRVYWRAIMPSDYAHRFLDHADLSTTSRYLKATPDGMHHLLQQVMEQRIYQRFASEPESGRESGSASALHVAGKTPVSQVVSTTQHPLM